ncbi:gastrula zinc finger protein XlCGF67.1 [Nilaparvata lugens]|uniref:gastrula zinc finger protein XlCGF67.1 n=1 Tax=Nilaparvata lugens TaxID=108931 RepID=UPI000B984C75|nr:gastrula zinc finger protein XlCGF67.1 [Nilaparvata lugens]XP_039281894.1 gastrula zinc finger protein XlCGF67.1 [Nilaparvata lugens]XP_039281895.1 gastrula zinc finger protein XlCGF67.1 [Nilaparvata lugens]
MSSPLREDSEDTESESASSVSHIDYRKLKKDVKYIVWPPVEVEVDTIDSDNEADSSDDTDPHPTKKRKVLRMKRKKVASIPSHFCPKCYDKFPSQVALALHLQVHYSNEIFCLTCQKQFSDKSELDLHSRQVHTQPMKISCKTCCKTFTYRSYASKDVYRKDFVCFFCNKKSVDRTKGK